jgi:hypothetical protein
MRPGPGGRAAVGGPSWMDGGDTPCLLVLREDPSDELPALGYPEATLEKLLQMRIHGVDADYVRALSGTAQPSGGPGSCPAR